jgi:hypothetical protein
VFVYEHDEAWEKDAKLVPADAGPDDGYAARDLEVHGDRLVVGAWKADTGAGPDAGAAYEYRHTSTGWALATKFEPDDADAGDAFGCRVALDGDTTVVNAVHDDAAGVPCPGRPTFSTRDPTVGPKPRSSTAHPWTARVATGSVPTRTSWREPSP